MIASVVARSLYGATSTVDSTAWGTPLESGVGAGNAFGERVLTLIAP